MLKYIKHIPGVLLLLATVVMGAYVPPTYAASAPITITHIQAGGVGATLQEFVAIYNNSPDEVDITDWCLKNKSGIAFACFGPTDQSFSRFLPGYSYAIASSSAMPMTFTFHPTIIYAPSNQSSGSIVGSADSISLFNALGELIDNQTWTTGISGGTIFLRQAAPGIPPIYIDTDQPSDWHIQEFAGSLFDGTIVRESPIVTIPDSCPNLGGLQETIPNGYFLSETGECLLGLPRVIITELLPNAKGSDEGREFIELYNPTDQTVVLAQYKLWVGPSFEKSYSFPAGAMIPAYGYMAFTNKDISYSLLNSSSRVRLTSTDGTVIDETPSYQNPDEDMAWALIDGQWAYTDQPTPGAENIAMTIGAKTGSSVGTGDLKPCADNQYRSPETNRCRLISSGETSMTPCKEGQYRSEETNRCRNITAEVGPAPCAEGQERNPDTNRCRTIKSIATADYSVLGARTDGNSNWYLWLAIGGLALVIITYGIWEWRYEIGKVTYKLAVFARIRK